MDITNQIQDILSKAGNYIHGKDSEYDDLTYTSIAEWKEECGLLLSSSTTSTSTTTKTTPSDSEEECTANNKTRQQWYQTGYDYYENEATCSATVDGVLGGFANLSKRDLEGSIKFIKYLTTNIRPELKLTKEENNGLPTHACECGAGIGRVTKGLLLPLGITNSDLVEPSPRLISCAPTYLGDEYASKCRYFCTGLQDFTPEEEQYYEIIWIQWVIIYITDEDFIDFLKRCAVGLRKGGVIVIKDNTCEDEAFIHDRDDSSITRSLPYILAIAKLVGLRVVYQTFQEDFPKSIFPVPMIAFEPIEI